MRIGLFDIFIMTGFGLWILFPIGLYIANRQLYSNSDQHYQFRKNFKIVIGVPDVWEGKHDEWEEGETEAEVLEFKQKRPALKDQKKAA